MTPFILPLHDPLAAKPDRVGPKAANLARLMQAGLPTPGGFALTADAYRRQLRHLGIEHLLRQYTESGLAGSRPLSTHILPPLYPPPLPPPPPTPPPP